MSPLVWDAIPIRVSFVLHFAKIRAFYSNGKIGVLLKEQTVLWGELRVPFRHN
jgi:hypothetical protein